MVCTKRSQGRQSGWGARIGVVQSAHSDLVTMQAGRLDQVAFRAHLLLALCAALSFVTGGREALAQDLSPGAEFRVNSVTAGYQGEPRIGTDADGDFVVAWSGSHVGAQRLHRAGRRQGGEIVVNPIGFGVDVGMNGAGDFAVVWAEGAAETAAVRRFDPSGAARRGSFQLGNSGSLYGRAVAMRADGSFVAAWADFRQDVHLQRFDRRGRAAGGPSESLSNGRAYTGLSMAANAAGASILVWVEGERGIVGQRFDRNGGVAGGTFSVRTDADYQFGPDVAVAPNGAFVVTWEVAFFGGGHRAVAQRFDAAGARVGPVIEVVADPGLYGQVNVAVARDRSLVAVWSAEGEDGLDVHARQFDSDGAPIGAEFRVNTHTPGNQLRPAAAFNATGELLVAWEGDGPDSQDSDIFAKRFYRDGAAGGDADRDGVDDAVDNCPTVPNADQADAGSDQLGDACVAPDAIIHPTAELGANPIVGAGTVIGDRALIGDDVTIGDGVTIASRVVLGNDVEVGADTLIEASASVSKDATIGQGASIGRNAVVGPRVQIEDLVVLETGARVGRGAVVEMAARIGSRAVVAPGAVVPAGSTVLPGTSFR